MYIVNYWYLKILLQAFFKIGDKSKAVFHSNCQDCFSHFTCSFTEAINEKVNVAASWNPVQPLTVEAASPAQCQCLFVFCLGLCKEDQTGLQRLKLPIESL